MILTNEINRGVKF